MSTPEDHPGETPAERAHGYIHDWNTQKAGAPPARAVTLLDETLRDGLQSPSVVDPRLLDKRSLLRAMDAMGVGAADLGLPGAGARQAAHVRALCEQIRDEGLAIHPAAAARTLTSDITPIIAISDITGVPLEILAFLGASPIRTFTEGWSLRDMRRLVRDAVRQGVRAGLPVSFVTEDTVRAHPDVLEALYAVALDEGASRIVICDTVGHATPTGVERLVRWTRDLLDEWGHAGRVGLDFHGHNDRGLALSNALVAAAAGADRLHGTALGIGERVGNTALDQLVINLALTGGADHDTSTLMDYCELASHVTGHPIPSNYPVVGSDAFRTGTGVHAAAIVKAMHKGSDELADLVYSGVPASLVGRRQRIEIGPMSGESNILGWLSQHGIAPNPVLVATIFKAAKRSDRVLRDGELRQMISRVVAAQSAA